MAKKSKILICPLDWGIGHAARDVPVIREFLEQGAGVIIAGEGRSFEFLKGEFPQLPYVRFPGYDISYPATGNMAVKMAFSAPRILYKIRSEYKFLDKLINELKPDAVISDNRFGVWSSRVPSVFITHQVSIKAPPGIEPVINRLNLSFIKKFDECWIPDFEGNRNLSGDLSHKRSFPVSCFFIGPLSRFRYENHTVDEKYYSDILILLSGPEPQRSILEDLLLEQAGKTGYKCVVFQGKTEEDTKPVTKGNVKVFPHLRSTEMVKYIVNAGTVISRPGYSTIMDLAVFGKKAVFIPTPGQTEQEYLARRLLNDGICFSMSQKEFDMEKALKESERFTGLRYFNENNDTLKKRVAALLERIWR